MYQPYSASIWTLSQSNCLKSPLLCTCALGQERMDTGGVVFQFAVRILHLLAHH